MPHHQPLEQGQLSVKEMTATRYDSNGEYLRARPIHDRRERHRVIGFPMNDQCALVKFRRNGSYRESAGGGSDQNHLFDRARGGQLRDGMAGHERAEREARQGNRTLWRDLLDHRQQCLRVDGR